MVYGGKRTKKKILLTVKAWDKVVNEDHLRTTVDLKPRRIKSILDAGGGHIKY